MKSKVFIVLLFLLSSSGFLVAQSNQEKAKAYYFQAEDAYQNRKYDQALEFLNQTEKLLGSSNGRIQLLRVQCLYDKGDYREAKKAIDRFFTLNPSDGLIQDMSPYTATIDEKYQSSRGFEQTEEFKNGVALVKKNEKWGLINNSGDWIVNPKWENAILYKNGFMVVYDQGVWGLIDISGKYLFTPLTDYYYDIQGFDDVVIVYGKKTNICGLLNKEGNWVMSSTSIGLKRIPGKRLYEGYNKEYGSEKFRGIMDNKGQWLMKITLNGGENDPLYDINFTDYDNGMAVYNLKGYMRANGTFKNNVNNVGLMDSNGKILISPDKQYKIKLSNGYAIVTIPTTKKTGIMDVHGNWIIPAVMDDVPEGFDANDQIRAKQNGFWGILNKDKTWALSPDYEFIGEFNEGYASVKKDGRLGYIYKLGKSGFSVPFQHQFEACYGFNSGMALVKRDGYFGMINTSGNFVIEPKYESFFHFGSEDFTCIKQSGKWGLIDLRGNWIITPTYQDRFIFSEGLASVKLSNDRYVFINKTGEIVIE